MCTFLILFVTVLCSALVRCQQGPITLDFQAFLKANGYQKYNFARTDLGTWGSYGGRTSANQTINNQPVVFIHGNSDAALYHSFAVPGWSQSIKYFLSKGYTSAELYATTWGDASALAAALQTHDCATLTQIRQFINAVLEYTKADKIDVIGHSMGVTIGRKVIKGGSLSSSCNLGDPLTDQVDTFVGISGANYGLCSCQGVVAYSTPTCNSASGFWPGDYCGLNYLGCALKTYFLTCNPSSITYSSFLAKLNANSQPEGSYIFSMWSLGDQIIGNKNNVWSRPTSLIPGSTDRVVYQNYSHLGTKGLTADEQYKLVTSHQV